MSEKLYSLILILIKITTSSSLHVSPGIHELRYYYSTCTMARRPGHEPQPVNGAGRAGGTPSIPAPVPRYAGGRPPSPPHSPLRIPRTVSVSLNEPNLFPIPIPIPGGSPLGPWGLLNKVKNTSLCSSQCMHLRYK